MNNPTLLLDVNYLAHKARCAYPNLSHDGQDTNVIFGIMKDIVQLQKKFGTGTVAWFFDGTNLKREQIYSGYKRTRKKKVWDKQQLIDLKSMKQQMSLMYNTWLHEMGYKNIHTQQGYEADDLIAAVCKHSYRDLLKGSGGRDKQGGVLKFIIVASDKDYYQLLSHRVSVWHPQQNKLVTEESFTNEWKIAPSQWATVKALSGCSSDEVPGPKGIGEKTAACWIQQHSDSGEYEYKTTKDFIAGKIKQTSKAYQSLVDWIDNENGFSRNLKLVKLPFPGTKQIVIKPDDLAQVDLGARRLAAKLKMDSLFGPRERLLGKVE